MEKPVIYVVTFDTVTTEIPHRHMRTVTATELREIQRSHKYQQVGEERICSHTIT